MQHNLRGRFVRCSRSAHGSLEPPFGSQFLLGDLENPIVDHPVQSEILIQQAGTNVFIEHLLKSGGGDRQVGSQARRIEIPSRADNLRIALEAGLIARLDRFFLIELRQINALM